MSGITDPTEDYFKDGQWGWDGTQWRKLALVFGFSEQYEEVKITNDVSAGTNSLNFGTVPAGEVWVIGTFCAYANQANPTHISLAAGASGSEYPICVKSYPTASLTVNVDTPVVLAEGDRLVVHFYGCASGDDIRAHANGYKMKVAE